MTDNESFGCGANSCVSAAALSEWEANAGRKTRFTPLDTLIGGLIVRSLQGERIMTLGGDKKAPIVSLENISTAQRTLVDETWSANQQKARGALYLPEGTRVVPGKLNLPWAHRIYGRFTSAIVWEEAGRVALQSSDAVLLWSVLEPLFDTLFMPFALREHLCANLSRENQLQRWADVDELMSALGFEAEEDLAVFRYGGGWHKLRADAQLAAKQRLLETLAHQATPEMGNRYRCHRTRVLLAAYYKKAKDGRATRRQVVTKALQNTLSGFFGGDWLAVLDYLGEAPHPEEQVVTALPEIKLYTGSAERVTKVAAQLGLPEHEVQRMVGAFWQEADVIATNADSPIERRVTLLRLYWATFDEIHTRQNTGMTPLWGLVDDWRSIYGKFSTPSGIQSEQHHAAPHHPGLFRRLLPQEIQSEIETLWGTSLLPRWPESRVTELHPHNLMAGAFGAALKFWHGCALTAWFLCEGPYSRTDMAGLAHYYRREVEALDKAGTPLDPRLFDELIEGEKRLGPEQPIIKEQHTTGAVTMTVYDGAHRDGFDRLRDIITRYRQAWTQAYLDTYLRFCWESEAREVAQAHSLAMHEKGKPPSLKQFAKVAANLANHWFGGDISGVYRLIGEKSPVELRYTPIMPQDKMGFVIAVNKALGGDFYNTDKFANEHLWYVQLQEVLNRAPTLPEFGASKFQWLGQAINEDQDKAWTHYQAGIAAGLRYSAQSQ